MSRRVRFLLILLAIVWFGHRSLIDILVDYFWFESTGHLELFTTKFVTQAVLLEDVCGLKSLPSQVKLLQVSAAVASPGHVPPWASTTLFDLVFTRKPVPHVFEHGPESHWIHVQATLWNIIRQNGKLIIIDSFIPELGKICN